MVEWRVGKTKEDHWIDLEYYSGQGVYEDDGSFVELPDYRASVKWDGCIHLNEFDIFKEIDGDYLHICDLDSHIEMLCRLRDRAVEHFGEKHPDEWGPKNG